MTWMAPPAVRSGGSLAAGEAEILPGLLDWERSTLLLKCAGLSGAQLALAAIPPSNLSLLGLVRHMSKVERVWFRRRLRGDLIDKLYSTPERPDADFEDAHADQAQDDYECLLAEQELSRQAAAGAPLDAMAADPEGDDISLRMIFHHMIREYSRHNGHADLLRQCVDGATGA